MKGWSVWRCKQCGMTIYNAEDAKIPDNALEKIFSFKTVCNNLKGFEWPTVEYTHRCDAQTIGLCELIGWGKQE